VATAEQTRIPFLDDAAKIEFGEIPSPPLIDSERSTLTVASYNIRYAVGRYLISSGVLRKIGVNPPLSRAAAVLRNIATAAVAFSEGRLLPRPDILALQEADKGTERAGGLHVARELATSLKMGWVHLPAGIPRGVPPKKRQWWLDFEEQIGLNDPGDTGIALLSRLPLEAVTRIDLPWHDCLWRPRLALAATISIGSRKVRIFNAHIDPHPEADGQLKQLEAMIDQADLSAEPTIVMGDFNTLSEHKCIETRTFLEWRGFTTPLPTGTPTWRGAGLRFHADWIFVRDLKINRWGVARPLNVSDHWPIWAEVSLPISD
jgi:endonuclease/exonuclease/phosphatase family metal-dependent hydrolase